MNLNMSETVKDMNKQFLKIVLSAFFEKYCNVTPKFCRNDDVMKMVVSPEC